MKLLKSRVFTLVLSVLLIVGILSGCTDTKKELPEGAAVNNILTFENNAENKPVIRIGMQYYAPDSGFIDALKARFPDYVFVLNYGAAAGTGQEERLLNMMESKKPLDMIVSGRMYFVRSDMNYYCDLSAESFLNNYLLASLNNVSVDGKIYFLPGVTSLAGIAYNTEMFAEYGWEVPTTTDEFFALCETIRQEGISPFSNCCKYSNQINRLFGTMCYDKLFKSDEDILWHQNVQENKATFTGHMEPFYELAKRFADEEIITIDDFSASLTKQRQAFWAREYAMMFADTSLHTYAQSEGATFKLGFMPFPAENSEDSGYCVTPNYYIALPKQLEENPERLALMKDILAYLSTAEGQTAMLSGNYNISNVKGVDISENPDFEYIREAYERGNLYPQIEYLASNLPLIDMQKESIQTLFEGGAVEDALAMMDASLSLAFAQGVDEEEYEVIATAEEAFTTLETSYYLADKLREAAGCEIGLMVNNSYFRSNLADIDKGDVTSDMRRYVMKGVDTADRLTTYNLTGAQIKELLEHPIVNGSEIDALVAASGLRIEYAPWNERGSRVIKLTMEDGSEIIDDKLYTVAAWAGVIDEKYITETVQTHEELGEISELLLGAFKKDSVIRPDIADRVTLVWPEKL